MLLCRLLHVAHCLLSVLQHSIEVWAMLAFQTPITFYGLYKTVFVCFSLSDVLKQGQGT